MERRDRTETFYKAVFQWSLWTLPYLYFVSLGGVFAVLVYTLKSAQKIVLDPWVARGLLLISGLLVLSSLTAFNRAEACLQLANFLPFFLIFATLPFLLKRFEILEQLAFGLVMAAIPINCLSLGEYLLKAPFLPLALQNIDAIARLRNTPHVGRAMVMFDHPNVLASYLVMVLGLGLGLVLKHSQKPLDRLPPDRPITLENSPKPYFAGSQWQTRLLYWGTYLNLVGIFCSGSRNGSMIAISQLVLVGLFTKTKRLAWIGGALGVGAIALSIVILGIGGRTLSVESFTDDPRVGVWQIALDLMRERPWLGWGLGNYKLLYPERLIDPQYDYIAHPHNVWLLLGSEAGIPLMLLMTLWVSYICYRAVRAVFSPQLNPGDRGIAVGYLFAFWGCVGFAFFDVTLYDAGINLMNWVMLAGVYAVASLDSSS